MTTALIHLNGVHKTYQSGIINVPVLKDINLQIEAGEEIAIMGRSGAGKSTMLNILGCLDRPSQGDYFVGGKNTAQMLDDELSVLRGQTIGFVFQSFYLLPHLTVTENVQLPMEYQKTSVLERKSRAEYLLDKVGLSHRLRYRPNQLSGGERQRVAIARSLANRPKILLADEPTGNLDLQAQQRILDLFRTLLTEEGITFIVVTHDQGIAEQAPRIVNLSEGTIVEDKRQ